jgi:4-diphosphocytidyl-2C-methyl-D-erythritol kinase
MENKALSAIIGICALLAIKALFGLASANTEIDSLKTTLTQFEESTDIQINKLEATINNLQFYIDQKNSSQNMRISDLEMSGSYSRITALEDSVEVLKDAASELCSDMNLSFAAFSRSFNWSCEIND